MPWQPDGTFLRKVGVDPTYSATPSGELWGQDLSASIKIIASRHDYHDEDLGTGIADCLNLDGYNTMRAGIKMGGNFITGIANGISLTDAPAYGQCIGSMTYVGTTLSIFNRTGTLVDTVTITAGGGGTGTVTSVAVDSTLSATPNPIVSSGSIGLKALANPGQVYSNNINGLTLDDYGRVTAVVTGTSGSGGEPDQTLSGNRTGTTFDLLLSQQTGSNTVTIPESSETGAGVMSNTQHNALRDLSNATTGAALQNGNNDFTGTNQFRDDATFYEEVWIQGNLDCMNSQAQFGSSGIPGVLAKGLQINTNGDLLMPSLPTASGGLISGQIWSDGGTLKVIP